MKDKRVTVKGQTHVAMDRWLSVDEIANYIGVSRDTIYSWLSEKRMPSHKVGKLWKFKLTQVDKWVESGKAAGKTGK